MTDLLKKHIKTNIAQFTQLFDIDTQNVSADTQNNVITIAGLDGEYTLSGGIDGTASKGCVNQTFDFVNGSVVTDCYFGDTQSSVNLIAHKVNVGVSITRELAQEMILDEKVENSIIVYIDSMRNATQKTNRSISEDLSLKVSYSLGVMFKIDAQQMESIGCVNTDVVFINSVLGTKKQTSSMIKFNSVVSRFFAGRNYIVDYDFTYEDVMLFDDIIKERVKHFDTVFDTLQIN